MRKDQRIKGDIIWRDKSLRLFFSFPMLSKPLTLSNVVLLRNILIILVFYHAFAIYSGAWSPIKGFPEIRAYWWLDKLSYAFMLELFVFISGYVFGYQVRVKGESKLQAKDLFWGKFKRLMIPSMVFSLLYIFLLGNIEQPIYKTAYDLVNGVGHMWFLPMLFWCFVGVWIIEKLHLKPKWMIPLLILVSVCSFLPLPLQMAASMYYILFFYVGYIIQRNDISLDWLYTKRSAIVTTLSFLVLFPLLTLTKERIGVIQTEVCDDQLLMKVFLVSIQKAIQLVYSSAGIFMMLSLVGGFLKNHNIPQWTEQVAALSFGVYLFQQFILMGLYYHTTLPSLIGANGLPWLGFVSGLFGSLLMAYWIRKTKIGRLLI